MKADGVRRAVAFTQYPQYSCSTTGSSLNELWRLSRKFDVEGQIEWSVIDRWPAHKGFVEVVARHIEESLRTYGKEDRGKVVLLFSAHSLPMSVVNRGLFSLTVRWGKLDSNCLQQETHTQPKSQQQSTPLCNAWASRTPTDLSGNPRSDRHPGSAHKQVTP